MRKDRLLSLIIAVGYAIGYAVLALSQSVRPGPPAVVAVSACLLLILCLIWFGDRLGEYRDPALRGSMDQKAPGWVLKLMGWLFLLAAGVPLAIALYARLTDN